MHLQSIVGVRILLTMHISSTSTVLMDHILDWLFCKCSNQSSIVFPNFVSPVTTGMEQVDLNTNETIYFTCYSVFNGSYAKQIIMLREKKTKTPIKLEKSQGMNCC